MRLAAAWRATWVSKPGVFDVAEAGVVGGLDARAGVASVVAGARDGVPDVVDALFVVGGGALFVVGGGADEATTTCG